MNDTPRRERRSPVVVLLDAAFGLAAALQTGQLPGRRVREEGTRVRRGAAVAWLTAGVLAAIVGTVILAVTLVRTPDGLASLPPTVPQPLPPASTSPTPAASPSSAHPRTPSSSPSVSPSRTTAGIRPASPPGAAVAVPLTARYVPGAGGSGLLGYRSTVTITNPARGPKTGWVLTITLPRPTLAVDQVSGATATQDGSTWTFVPDGSTRQIQPGKTVTVAFSVRGATLLDATPQDCRIDGNACTGLPN